MTNVPNLFMLAAMGRWFRGLLAVAALAAGSASLTGCASAAPADSIFSQTGPDEDMGDADLAGGGVVGMCVDGGSCDTGNPGDCSMGHAVCSGNVQSCVPDVTTQRCYSGPAATANVGVCKPGTQTCIGAIGSCAGEVTPAAVENCFNDLDDDCDGVVNNGCPQTLTTGTPRALTARGDTAGGSAFSLRCPANTFVSKIIVYGDSTDGFMAGIDVYCATPTLVRGTSSYSVTESVSATALTRHANNITTSANLTYDCGTGFSPGWGSSGYAESGGIDAIGLYCGSPAINLAANNQLNITFAKTGNGAPGGYTQFGTLYEEDCAAGEVVIGYDGRSGNWLDELHAICAPLQVVYK
jgi:hypothetical protein